MTPFLFSHQQITVHAVRRSVDVLGTASWGDPQAVLFNTLQWDGGVRAATISSHQLVLHAAGVRGFHASSVVHVVGMRDMYVTRVGPISAAALGAHSGVPAQGCSARALGGWSCTAETAWLLRAGLLASAHTYHVPLQRFMPVRN